MRRIGIVEDDELIRSMIKLNLEKSGFIVSAFVKAESLLDEIDSETFDLLLLDIMLPGISGEKLLNVLRKKGISIPVIMVTAKSGIGTKLTSFESGADDYISKPFNMDELKARIEAVIRRSQGERMLPSNQIVNIGRFEVNFDTRMALTQNGPVKLTEKEYKLLKYFFEHQTETLNRVDILENVWGMDTFPTTRTIDNFVLKFRKLFEENPEDPKHFITIHAAGYQFVL